MAIAARRDDAGAVAVVTAITLTVLLLVSAIVIDLAALRADRVNSKSVADLSVTAGAVEYDPVVRGSARAACLEAVGFLETNLGSAGPSLVAVDGCESVFPDAASADVCDVSISTWNPPRVARYAGGPYEVEITIPVVDSDEIMGVQALDASYDGEPCERVGVRVTRDRGFSLAGIAGFDRGQTTQASVARWREDGEEDVFASLIVLQRDGCNTLRTSGQGRVNITDGPDRVVDGESIPTPGTITMDTMPASCNPTASGASAPVINVGGNDISFVRASGNIFMEGLRQGAPQPQLYQADRVASGFLAPQPRRGPLITRAPIDHRYNCLTSYASGDRWSPTYSSGGYTAQPIDACSTNLLLEDGGTVLPPPYIKLLVDSYQGLSAASIPTIGAETGDTYDDWLVYPRDVPGGDCKAGTGSFGPSQLDTPTARSGNHWFIDCSASGNSVFSPQDIEFVGVKTVVSRNWIDVNSDAFRMSGTAADGAILYLQGADNSGTNKNSNRGIERGSQSIIAFDDVFVYSHNGWIDIVGGTGGADGASVTWNAAERATRATCSSAGDDDTPFSGVPTAGCFAPLALWSNSRFEHGMGGNASLDVRGIFFTPNADPFNLSGQSPQTLTAAQFFSNRFEISGQAAIEMAPDAAFNDPIPLGSRALIR